MVSRSDYSIFYLPADINLLGRRFLQVERTNDIALYKSDYSELCIVFGILEKIEHSEDRIKIVEALFPINKDERRVLIFSNLDDAYAKYAELRELLK